MQLLRSLLFLAAAVATSSLTVVNAATSTTTTAKYFCETDAECETKFPGTVCIAVDNYGIVTKKCTPNTKERPACRGGTPGLCPSYQSEDIGYLNVHCVFVAADPTESVASADSASSSSGSAVAAKNATASARKKNGTTRGRWLMVDATKASSTGSAAAEVKVPAGSGSSSSSTSSVVSSGSYAKVKIANQTVTGVFKCVDASDCQNQAYDPTTCFPSTCGSPTSLIQCNNHGTCSYPSVQTMGKRACSCYAGYGGDKCQQEISNACDVDCGYGGDCVDGACKCKKGYDGASYKGKKGKPNQRCTACTNDLACQNSNQCDIQSGACVCSPGFSGPTCGATDDSCTTKSCGTGSCRLFSNGSSACYCPICAPDCQICPTKDCSTCPSPASTVFLSKMVVFASAIAMVISHFVL